MAANLDYSLDPYGVQAAQIAQRQRLAQQMVDQGMSNTPVYSDKAGIAKALMIALGQVDAGQAGRQELALAKQRQADERSEVERIIGAATAQQGQPPVPATPDVPGGGPPASLAPNAPPVGMPGAAPNGRFALAQIMARSSNPQLAQAGLGMLLKGPDAPLVKETPDGLVVLSPDGMHVLNRIGGAKIAPPSAADVTPESLAAYQRSGDPSLLVPRIKQVPVDTGGGMQFVNPEAPPPGVIPKTMSPGEAATNARAVAELQDKGVRLPGAGGGPGGPPAPGGPLSGGPLNYGNMGNVSPATQNARDGDRMSILLGERQQQIAQTGKSDPQLDIEIADMQRRGFGGAPQSVQGPGSPGMSSVPGLSPADQRAVAASTAQGLSKGGVDYKNSLDTRVQAGADLMNRINESEKALSQFQPGMGAETRLTLARLAQAMGGNSDLVNRINAGDVSAKQEFQKLAAQQAMESLKQAMGGTGRITQAEFKIFQQNNPNIELDPGAIGKIFAFSRSQFLRDQGEQQGLYDYVQRGGNIGFWPAVWAQKQVESGIVPNSGGSQGGPSVDDLIKKYAR